MKREKKLSFPPTSVPYLSEKTQGDKKQSGHEKPASAKSAPASLTLAMEPLNKGEDTLSPLIHQDGLN